MSLNDIFRGKETINNSKGCGGVMRIAPIPLYAAVDNRMDIMEADKLAGDAAENHPSASAWVYTCILDVACHLSFGLG